MVKHYERLDLVVERLSGYLTLPGVKEEMGKLRSPNDIIYVSNRLWEKTVNYVSGSFIPTIDPKIAPYLKEITDIANEESRDLSTRDYLTGLFNRKHLDFELETEFARRNVEKKSSIMMFDIDYFKKFNDNYGHNAGDSVLVTLSDIVSKNIRGSDDAFRYGGEEFVVLFRDTCQADALNATYELEKKIADTQMIFSDKRGNRCEELITISGGIVEMNSKISGKENIKQADKLLYYAKENIKQADKLLYYVKEHGRNNVAYMENGSVKMLKD